MHPKLCNLFHLLANSLCQSPLCQGVSTRHTTSPEGCPLYCGRVSRPSHSHDHAVVSRYSHLPLCVSVSLCLIFLLPPALTQPITDSINRAELAGALLRVERCYYTLEADEAQRGAINKSFDDATLLFFGGDFPKALNALNNLVLAWQPEYKDNPAMHFIASLRARITPRVFALDSGAAPEVQFTALYESSETQTRPENIFLFLAPYTSSFPEKEKLIALGSAAIPQNSEQLVLNLPLALPQGGPAPGLYNLYLANTADAQPRALWLAATWAVVDAPLANAAQANKAALDAITPADAHLEQAKIAVELRNGLLTDSPQDLKSPDYVLDPSALKRDIADEITKLQNGENPFLRRKGDYWRAFKTSVGKVPARVHVPGALNLDAPVPALIAFHGAGGDENMFVEAYGLGILKQLADKHGLLLISPLTYAFTGPTAGGTVKQMLDILKVDYPIDESRVYVLGHSMGGGATAALVNSAPGILAAAACLCGASEITAPKNQCPPVLLVAAEFDPLASPSRIESVYNTALQHELPVEHQLHKNMGHTLVVGDILPGVIEWLLKHNK